MTHAIAAVVAADQSWKSVSRLPTPIARPSGDILLLRDGKRMTGTLVGCGGSACRFNGNTIERARIEWIGLSGAVLPSPQLDDPAAARVFLAGGEVKKESLLSVNTHEVETDAGSYPREEVRWIHLAGPVAPTPTAIVASSAGADDQAPPPPPPTPAPPKPPPPPAAPPKGPTAPQRPSPPGDVVKPCPAENPLGGWAELEVVRDTGGGVAPSGCEYTVRTALRFQLAPQADRSLLYWPRELAAVYCTTRLTYQVESAGCVDVPGDDEECSAPGARTSGEIRLGDVGGGIYRALPVIGHLDFTPNEPALSFLPPKELTTAPQPSVCRGLRGSGGSSGSLPYRAIGFHLGTQSNCDNDPFVFCTTPTGCKGATDPKVREDCIVHADRHAVIPFEGEKSYQDATMKTRLKWKVCCGCGAPATPPEPSNDPCPDAAGSAAVAQRNRQERKAKAEQLKDLSEEYGKKIKEARSHLDEFLTTTKACAVQTAITKLLIGALGLFNPLGEAEIAAEGAEVAEDIAEAAQELAEGLGDPGKTVFEVIEKMLNNEDPSLVAVPNEQFQQARSAFEAAQQLRALLAGKSFEQEQEIVENCAGTIGLSYDTWHGAEQYMDSIKEAIDLLPQVQKLFNDIRDLDTQYPDLQYHAWADCLRRARCQGKPDSTCDALKPPGNWPDVPR